MSDGKAIAVASVRFRCNYLELFVTHSHGVTVPKTTVTALYSLLKTVCIELLHEMCLGSVLRYDLAIVCPDSEKDKPHFMIFDPLEVSEQTTILYCNYGSHMCDHDITSHPARNWVRAAYTGNSKNAIHPNGKWTSSISKFNCILFSSQISKLQLNWLISVSSCRLFHLKSSLASTRSSTL